MRMRFPHPLVLLVAFALLAAAASWLLPAGEYERKDDPVTGRSVVVSGTYHHVEPAPVGPFEAVVAIPKGAVDAASVIIFVFLIGGAFAVVDKTGAMNAAVNWLVHALENREALVIPIACLVFGAAGALEHMSEELIAFVPVLLLLTRRLGYNRLTAIAMSLGAAAVGAAFSPIDPFMAGIAQKIAGLPLLSGAGFRMVFLAAGLGFWIWSLARYANSTRMPREDVSVGEGEQFDARRALILLIVVAAFAMLVIGVVKFAWDFDQLAAMFFLMGVAAGLIGGLRLNGTAEAFTEGFRAMAYAALLIGFARAISFILQEGRIIDTIVHGLATPLGALPVVVSALGMFVAHSLIHLPVPSVSGQAVITMPILAPLSDVIGLSRQVAVLAYQYGAGLCELVTPTSGSLMAMLAATGVSYGEWIKYVSSRYAVLAGIGVAAIIIGISTGLQ
jgi:uncharacterized ion transporter superfamily protein YfcC